MDQFEELYNRLNPAQRQAVDTIDGPLLVIAGPGTGKTQLLSARVANILRQTDVLPQNILCLTFTENGAQNMRERLTRFIGQTAYSINIGTYHSFGSDVIYRFPQYFTATQLQNPVDELGKHQIIRDIIAGLSYSNPLKQLRHHLGDLIGTISEVKRALLSGDDLRAIASENIQFIRTASEQVSTIFNGTTTMPRTLKAAEPLFGSVLDALATATPAHPYSATFGSLAALAIDELRAALAAAQDVGKSTPLTAWKNRWLAKDENNQYVLTGQLENERITALADALDKYQEALSSKGLYDFDDMILRAIQALEEHADLRFTLQEQYQYLLLDEFQDTNAAQLRLVQLLSDNPVSEGRPNVMAVGDDDQAIYAFQGAQYSNMVDFTQMYRGVNIVNLTENYRSHADILSTAGHVADQIESRLSSHFSQLSKQLTAANSALPTTATVRRQELPSDIAQYEWIAGQIDQLIQQGTDPREIAVLAPKHRQLEPLVPYLNLRSISVSYEKRENILEAPVVRQLVTMSRLVLALHHNQLAIADALWPEVLSYDFWNIPTRSIWQLSWDVCDDKTDGASWTRTLLASQEECFRTPALLLCSLALRVDSEPCEAMLDYLIGSEPLHINESEMSCVQSPLRGYYTSPHIVAEQPDIFYETISHLRVLRSKLRDHQNAAAQALTLPDFIAFIDMYQAADERMLNTSPYNQQTAAVQLMTVFKAKGLEFAHVFLVSCHDDVWGGSSRGNTNRLTLPTNLQPIRHAGATDDERLRILFVAITRARFGLYLTSYQKSYSGSTSKRLRYLDEREQADGTFRAMALPEASQTVQVADPIPPQLDTLELDWRQRHTASASVTDLHGLLTDRLKNYQLSPTHLNQFVDVTYGGPQSFLLKTILRFPQEPSVDGHYGNTIHETLEWYQRALAKHGSRPQIAPTLQAFDERLAKKKLPANYQFLLGERGHRALTAYLNQRGSTFDQDDVAEHNFKHEGSFVGRVHMSGKIDRMVVDKKSKTIIVIDYKTGKCYSRWEKDSKLHKYMRQLYCYKLLIEQSHTYSGYTVTSGRLEFIDPDSTGKIRTLDLQFNDAELAATKALLRAMWQRVHALDFPDTSTYSPDLKGMLAFENALLDNEATASLL